ncbi:glycoside hydrolase family 43 protein [Deminuibacter soli]|uniref:glycoside hydrolase family 43 protein n=1 Tax=Deminuibacter soli TaxID=2291815 RepID=UPI0013145C1C|nr:glycoside hydrolase family 43 protein [Deminuibacter soli]
MSLFCAYPFFSLQAQNNAQAFISGDFADPSVIKAKDAYFAVATSSEWAPHFPIYRSKDLQHWTQAGYVFDKAPEWTSGSFWAPEYYFHNGLYYIYYTARRRSDNISCIGVATSKYPDKGFEDRGIVVSYGKEAIDGFIYKDHDQLYITFKAYGLDKRPIEILGSRLSPDGLKTEGAIFSLSKDTAGAGMEGQSILQHNGFYYLFYSSGSCCGNGCSYNVRVARSKNFKGPYEQYPQNPILQANEVWKCPGHGTFVQQSDGNYWYIHHAYNKQSNVFTGREGMLAILRWQTNDWPSFVDQDAGSKQATDITTAFTGNQLAKYWQWDFRNSSPVASQTNGRLQLSGTVKEGNNTGIVLAMRPVSSHFAATATIVNTNQSVKGLAFYGDADVAVGIGATGNKVEYWVVKNNKRTVLASQPAQPGIPVEVRLTMLPELTCTVAFRQGTADWQQVGGDQDISFLPRWDRSPRIGLHFQGPSNESAIFSGFVLNNL